MLNKAGNTPAAAENRDLLKIALIRSRYNPFGGAERFVSCAIDALRARGAEVTLVTRRWTGVEEAAAIVCDPFYLGSLWRDWGFARCVCAKLKQASFDLVQSHERLSCCDVYRAGDGVHREWLRQRRRVLGVFGKLGIALNPYHHYVRAAEKRLFNSPRLKAVICNSRMVKDEIRADFDVPESKLHVIYSGVDTRVFHPALKAEHSDKIRIERQIPLGATVFLLLGSGFERKGLAVLLQAMTQLPPDAHLLVVGKDKRTEFFQNRATSLGIGGRVHFVGGKHEVAPFYGAADVFVLPTLYDPFPNAALEAMAAGLPIITSFKSGAVDLIENGKNGFVCDALDDAQLAQFMRELMDGAQRQAMGAAARATVEPLTPEAMSAALVALYRGLLEAQ